jgi:hypothetical protein
MTEPDMRSLVEILPVLIASGRPQLLRPCGSQSWQVLVADGLHPERTASRSLAEAGLAPLVIHSTSWRHQGGRLVLVYLALLEGPAQVPPGFEAVPVRRQDLALGTATAAPRQMGVGQVVEHALRHLAWLIAHDPPVRKAMAGSWVSLLDQYAPAPPLVLAS